MSSTVKTLAAAVLAIAAAVEVGCAAEQECDGPKVSVFIYSVRRTAKQRGVSLAEAAEMLYKAGARGVDIDPDNEDLQAIYETKLKPINFYFFPKMLGPDNGAADCRRCMDQAVKYKVPRVMVVPSSFTKDGDEEAEFAKVVSSMKMFVEEGRRRGITVPVEDYGGTNNPCSHTKYLRRFLDEIPDLRFALDSGNLNYAGRGESIVDMMRYAKDRIAHVHLKDLSPDDNHKFVTLGLGVVPNEELVRAVSAAGYDGWYTLENPVGDVYTDVVRQTAVLKSWLAQ